MIDIFYDLVQIKIACTSSHIHARICKISDNDETSNYNQNNQVFGVNSYFK